MKTFPHTPITGNTFMCESYEVPLVENKNDGLTKREYFASKAMFSLITHEESTTILSQEFYNAVAKDAVMMADALINALNQ